MSRSEEITLPGGLLAADGRVHRRARLRPLNGRDEEWLLDLPPGARQAPVATALLARCLESLGPEPVTEETTRALGAGDRRYLLLRLWRITFGPRLALVLDCRRCGARMDVDVEIDAIPVEARPVAGRHRVVVAGLEMEVRLPTGADEEALALGDGDEAALLDACVLSPRPPPEAALSELARVLMELTPGVSLQMEASCPECGHVGESALDPAALLIGESRRGRRDLDRELHLLAFHYHWSLSEILDLTRPRRRRFLDLLREELSR